MFFLDLDRFKVVNDRIGHAAADEVLVSVARRLEACTRHGDTHAAGFGHVIVSRAAPHAKIPEWEQQLSAGAAVDRTIYQYSQLTDGTSTSNDDRNYSQYGGIGRVSYEVMPGLKPFGEAQADQVCAFIRDGRGRDDLLRDFAGATSPGFDPALRVAREGRSSAGNQGSAGATSSAISRRWSRSERSSTWR